MQNEVYKLLNLLNIKYTKVEHPPLFTCEDNKKYNIKFDAMICKNLFIRNNNKSHYYVISILLEKRIDLKKLQIELEETRLSFADENILEEKLGIRTGAVSIFNIINLTDKNVFFILDEEILSHKKVGFHPNINTETVIFDPKEIKKIFDYYNVKYTFKKFENIEN